MKTPYRSSRDDAAAYVDAFRAEVDRPVDVEAAWGRFEEAVGSSHPVPWWGGARFGVRVGVGGAVLAAALAVAWVARPAADTAVELDGTGHQARDEAIGSGTEGTPVPAPAPRRAAAAAPPVTVEPPPVADGEREGEENLAKPPPHLGRRGKAAVDALEAPGPGPSRLEEELRLLDAMRSASSAGLHTETLELVRAHAGRFGEGPFAAERELTRVRALCGLGRLEAVREAKADFAASFPTSHLASLVRSTCNTPTKADAAVENSDHDR